MKEILIDTYQGTFHPCQIEWVRKDPLRKNRYIMFFFDRVYNDYFYANLVKQKGEFFVEDLDYSFTKHSLVALGEHVFKKVDLSELPPYMKSVEHKKLTNNDVIVYGYNNSFQLIKKTDFLELESYANCLTGPEYLYFKILDSTPNMNGFSYVLEFSEKSSNPLKKRVIAKHKTTKALSDIFCDNGIYTYTYDNRDSFNVNLRDERILVQKLIEINRGKRKNLDPELLTKMVRIMLAEEDRMKAAREYQMYLNTFYGKWEKEKKYMSR